MITTLIAAAAVAVQPAAQAPANPHAQHAQHGKPADHKAMDCCKDCCKDMAKKEHGERAVHDMNHADHSGSK